MKLSDDDLIFSKLKLDFKTKCKINAAPTSSGSVDIEVRLLDIYEDTWSN